MIKKLLNTTLLTLSIVAITIASFSLTISAQTTNLGSMNDQVNISIYSHQMNANFKSLFNDAQFNFNTNSDSTMTSDGFNLSDYPLYYYVSSTYVYIFENGDAFVTDGLLQNIIKNKINPTMSDMRSFSIALGQLGLTSGSFRNYTELYSAGYRVFTQYSFYDIEQTRTIYITVMAHMGSATNNNIYTNNLSSNYQTTLELTRFDIPNSLTNNSWTYKTFTLTLSNNCIYDKSDNLIILNKNGDNYYCKIYNDKKSAFITFAQNINGYSNNFSSSSINLSFNYYLDDLDSTNYSNILNSIDNNLILIKNLISEFEVNEINNIYENIINNYNIDIDNEINNYLDDLKININALNINDQKFLIPSNLNNQLSGLKNMFNNIFTTLDNNNAALFYIVPIVALIIGALI